MNILQKKSHKVILLSVTAILLLLVTATVVCIYAFNGSIFGWSIHQKPIRSVNDVNYGKPTKAQEDAGAAIQDRAGDGSDANKVGSDRPPEPVNTEGSKSTVPLTITAANQNGSMVQIRSLISAIVNNGTCTLKLTQGLRTVTKTSTVQSLPSSATCSGFDISTSELGVGEWQLGLVFESDKLKAEATSSITIQKVVQ